MAVRNLHHSIRNHLVGAVVRKEIVDALVASLNDPNAGWEYTKYVATNPRIKCEIWLANGIEWLEVKFYGPKIAPSKDVWEAQVRYGGELFLIAALVPWRWRVYLAATRQQDRALRRASIKDSTIIAAIQPASESAQ